MLTFLLISSLRVCCDSVPVCVSMRTAVLLGGKLRPSTCNNSSRFKPRYLGGQVEVSCLMSSMWPQLERCVVDSRLCAVSDWGLGLVTGPVLIGWPVPAQPAHAPSLRRGGFLLHGASEAWLERESDGMDGFLSNTYMASDVHTQWSSCLSAISPWAAECLLHWQQQPSPLHPEGSLLTHAAVRKAKCDCD